MTILSINGFAFYRLCRGSYAGWRIRDVWRHDPEALVIASLSPATSTRDAAMIGLFLALFGGLTYRAAPSKSETAVTLPSTPQG